MEQINYLTLEDFCVQRKLKVASVRAGLKRNEKNWPPYLKIGGLIRFRPCDVEKWEVSRLSRIE